MKTTIKEALLRASFLLRASSTDSPRIEAELLLANLLQVDRLQLLIRSDEEIDSHLAERFDTAVRERALGKPLAYITGLKYFYGRPFKVNPGVLIPRPETELIIETILHKENHDLRDKSKKLCCLDIGTGSGILAITLAMELPGAEVWAVDISEAALETAEENAAFFDLSERVKFLKSNYLDAFRAIKPKPQFSLVVSNPPYIRSADLNRLPREVKEYEPLGALCGGEDGLDGYRAVLDNIGPHLKSDALLLMEIDPRHREEIEALCRKSRLFSSFRWHDDLAGRSRVFEGTIIEKDLP